MVVNEVLNSGLNCKMSRDIQIKQSVRQGSILWTWLYMYMLSISTRPPSGFQGWGSHWQPELWFLPTARWHCTGRLQEMVRVCEGYNRRFWHFSYNITRARVDKFHGQRYTLPVPVHFVLKCMVAILKLWNPAHIQNAQHTAGNFLEQATHAHVARYFHVGRKSWYWYF